MTGSFGDDESSADDFEGLGDVAFDIENDGGFQRNFRVDDFCRRHPTDNHRLPRNGEGQ